MIGSAGLTSRSRRGTSQIVSERGARVRELHRVVAEIDSAARALLPERIRALRDQMATVLAAIDALDHEAGMLMPEPPVQPRRKA